jgi:hypothetical protein
MKQLVCAAPFIQVRMAIYNHVLTKGPACTCSTAVLHRLKTQKGTLSPRPLRLRRRTVGRGCPEAILALHPVTFLYKKELDPKGTPQFGLVAEEVAKVNSDLVVTDDQGKPFTVRYDEVNAMLLNEFLKEHCKVESIEATVEQHQKQIEAITVGLRRVSAQLELSRPTAQTVLNDQ